METPFSTKDIIKFCFSRFFRAIKENKALQAPFIFAIGVFVLALIFNIFLPLGLKFIVQSLESSITSPRFILLTVLGYGFIWTVAKTGEHLREMTSTRAVERALSKIIVSFYCNILNQPNFNNELPPTGSIINKLAIFREGFQNLIWGLLFFLLPTALEIIFACSILLYLYSFFYTGILTAAILLYVLCTSYGISRYLKHQSQTFEHSVHVSGFLSDRLFNIETVRSLGSHIREKEILEEKLSSLEESATRTKQVFEVLRIIQGIIIGCTLCCATYHCAYEIIQGRQVLSDFILINGYIIQFFTPLSSLGVIMNDIYKSFAEIAGMIDLMKTSRQEKLDSGSLIPNLSPFILSTKDLSFSYRADNFSFLLKDINIMFQPGWRIGIVGHSGSGKSTLGKLLSSLYSPERGDIFLDGLSYSSYDPEALKLVISFAPQQVQLFYDTIGANILYANPSATTFEIEKAIDGAQLREVIERMPMGLDTLLGEQGTSLSGGERQRVGIARILLKNPRVYVLDEPTSFLDLKTEKLILDYFQLQRGKTTQIIIAHRLQTIMDADWVLVMKNGEIISQGPPNSLLNTCSTFLTLWELDNPIYKKQRSIRKLRA